MLICYSCCLIILVTNASLFCLRVVMTLVYDVLEKNIDSSSKSNPLRRRQKNTTRGLEDGGVVVEKI